jgi:hypothetical protein
MRKIIVSNYVVAHGGDRDGSIWSSVEKILKENGHTEEAEIAYNIIKRDIQREESWFKKITHCIFNNKSRYLF